MGGDDPGAISGNLKEKDFTLKAANYMYNRFRELGVPVTITRDIDKTLSRQERLNIMRSLGTDPNVLVLSNHINAGGGEGAEVVYPLRTNDVLAKMILDNIGSEGQIMRKVYQRRLPEDISKDYYYIMRETPNTTALLIEYGFIDNKNDQVKLQNNILKYAEAVVKAVMNYIGLPYVSPGGVIDNTYTVKRGDTLYSIARQFNIPIDRLQVLNGLTSNILSVGQVLILDDINNENIGEQSNSNIYVVQSGDTLYKIANNYGITVGELIDFNNLNSTILSVGQELKIPILVNEEIIENVNTYQVQPGDTLYKIANLYGITVDELKNLNALTSNTLSIGQILTIPNINLQPSTQTYTVQRGDSLWLIANRLNTTVDKLKQINNLSTNLLQIGQVLLIPE